MQNISPGLVENDILTTAGEIRGEKGDNNELVKYMPRLKPEEVAQAVIFAITAPQNVLVSFVLEKVVFVLKQTFGAIKRRERTRFVQLKSKKKSLRNSQME